MSEPHSLSDSSSSEKISAAQADLDQFPTSNIYDGGCTHCACEIPIVLEYEDGEPVPDAEFVVKWGEEREGEDGEIIVEAKTEAQSSAPEIKGVVDANGLARVTNSPCGNYIILFGEGSDALQPSSLEQTSELYVAIEEATLSSGAGTLSPAGRGQLLWWLTFWMKEKATENEIQQIKNGDVSSKADVVQFMEEYGAPLWTDENGRVNEDKKTAVFDRLQNESLEDFADGGFFVWDDGPLYELEQELEDRREDFGYPDDPAARQVARSLERMLMNGNSVPNERFYQILPSLKQAEMVASQLVDPNEPSSWDVFLLVAEAILGFVPVIGDVIDVVDIIKWLYKYSDDEESPGTWDYVELGALSLGFIPAIGIVLKKTFAPIARFFASIRGASRVAGKASELLQMTIQVLRKLGDGNLIQWIVKKKDEVKEQIQLLKGILSGLCDSVVNALRKYIENCGWFSVSRGFAERIHKIFTDFKNAISDYIDPFFKQIDDMIANFIARLANRFVGSAGKQIDPTVFKLRRRNADGSGGLGERGNGQRAPEGVCPIGMRRAMGSNPINMILGQPFINETDVSVGHFVTERTWTPGQGGGLFGPLWSTPLSNYIKIGAKGAEYQTSMGRKIPLDVPLNGGVCVNEHAQEYELMEYGKGFAIRDKQNLLWIFEVHDGSVRRLSSLRDDNGVGFDIAYVPDFDAAIGLKPSHVTLTNGEIYDLDVRGGRLFRVTHRSTNVVEASFAYDKRGLLVSATNSAGFYMGYGYDDLRRIHIIDYNGEHYTCYSYDKNNRVIQVKTDTPYYHDQFEYSDDSLGQRTVTFTNTLGHKTIIQINAKNHVTAIAQPNNAITRFTYTEQGDIASETDPLGNTVKYDWDELSNLLKITYADNSTKTYERDKRGRLLSYTDEAGAQWSYERDDRGNIVAEHWPDGRCWRYLVDKNGQLTGAYNPDGSLITLVYNARGQLIMSTDALGAKTEYHYNPHGQLMSRLEADGSHSQYTYDDGGRLSTATLATGNQLQWRWSSRGNLLEATDGEGKTTRREYGPYGRLEAIIDPQGHRIRFEYDELMRLSSVINERGERHEYKYDANNHIISERDFSGRQLSFGYDSAGRKTQSLTSDGKRIHYLYTSTHRLSQLEVFASGESSPPEITRFAYDERGLLVSAQNKDATVELERDPLGRVVTEKLNGRVIDSCYNALGQLESRNFDGRSAQYTYDANGLLNSLGVGSHLPLQIERDVMGRERLRRSGMGFAEFRQWDKIGQLKAQIAGQETSVMQTQLDSFGRDIPKAISGGIAAARTYQYDRAFNPILIDDARWGTSQFHYNKNNQVELAQYGARGPGVIEERFRYDASRNIDFEQQIERGSSSSLLVEPEKHATQNNIKRAPGGRIERRGDTTYAWDGQGRLVSKRLERKGFRPQQWHYYWDCQDQLRRVHTPDEAIWEYKYDPFGRRIAKTCIQTGRQHQRRPVTNVDYLWVGHLLCEERKIYADGSAQTVAYHYEQSSFRPLAQEIDGELSYVVTDHLGTPKELLSEKGDIVWSAKYKVWGSITDLFCAANDSDGNKTNCQLRFQGQIEDEESGLYYNRFRYYDPQCGSYASADPLGIAVTFNPWSYVLEPTRKVDALGLASTPVTDTNNGKGYTIYGLQDSSGKIVYVGQTEADRFGTRMAEHTSDGRLHSGLTPVELDHADTYGQARGYEQAYIDKHDTLRTEVRGQPMGPGTEANRASGVSMDRTDERGTAMLDAYEEKTEEIGVTNRRIKC